MNKERVMEELFTAEVIRSGQLVDLEYSGSIGISEELVKDLVFRQLRKDHYSVKKSSPGGKGPDIEGSSDEGLIIGELKGEPSRPQEFHNYFWTVLGQILLRMTYQNARYVVALPIQEKFVRLVRQVPAAIRRKLSLEFWLVATKPVRYSIHILRPHLE